VLKLKGNLWASARQLNLLRLRDPSSVEIPYKIDRDTIIKFRKDPKIEFKRIASKPSVGTVNGMYATSAGIGGLTIIQAFKTLAKERLQLTLTGSQGDVMQESMSVARSVAWNLIPQEVKKSIYESPPEGLHIHCPEGATPKDGPSAGGAITTAIISQLLGIPIKNDVSMTGEIDLTGRITKIGGLSAKLHGAKKAGVRLALVPRDNAKDLDKIIDKFPELIDENFEVKIVDTIYDLLDNALVENPIKRPPGMVLFTDDPPSTKVDIQGDDEGGSKLSSGDQNSSRKRSLDESSELEPSSKKMRFGDAMSPSLKRSRQEEYLKEPDSKKRRFSDVVEEAIPVRQELSAKRQREEEIELEPVRVARKKKRSEMNAELYKSSSDDEGSRKKRRL